MNSIQTDPDSVLADLIIEDEGFIDTLYKDTEGLLDHWHRILFRPDQNAQKSGGGVAGSDHR